jgi:O-succinylbenzoic acid--CoA ligase
MHDWLSDRVAASPEATALVRAETGETWDYADLAAEVTEIARRLAALGVGSGDHLGMVLPARAAAIRVIHAGLRLGATLVPLGERLTAPELATRIERADVTAVVCDSATEEAVVSAAGGVPTISVDEPTGETATPLLETEPAPVSPEEWAVDDAQLILFTSGTTGTPKAVVLTPGNLLASAGASALRLGHDPADRWLVTLSLHHMGGIGPVLRAPLYGTAVVLRQEFRAGGVVDDIDRYDATGVSLVPTMLQRMFESRGTLPGSLRVVLLGGAPAPTDLIERCRDYSVPVYPTYGMTETASQVATARPHEAFDHLDTVGRPLFGTEVAVVDDDGEALPPGDVGELVVSGPTVSPGYYGDAEATEAAFGPRGLHTGDVGYRDEAGRVYVLNRKDDRIITGGENVDPGEVVEALREHSGVADAAVAGVPDEEWGERVAALVVRATPGLSRASIESHCRERLAGFKLPRSIVFAEELPRTVSGTVDREAVRERLLDEIEVSRSDRRRAPDAPGADDSGAVSDDAGDADLAADEADATDETDTADEADATDETDTADEADATDGADADGIDAEGAAVEEQGAAVDAEGEAVEDEVEGGRESTKSEASAGEAIEPTDAGNADGDAVDADALDGSDRDARADSGDDSAFEFGHDADEPTEGDPDAGVSGEDAAVSGADIAPRESDGESSGDEAGASGDDGESPEDEADSPDDGSGRSGSTE